MQVHLGSIYLVVGSLVSSPPVCPPILEAPLPIRRREGYRKTDLAQQTTARGRCPCKAIHIRYLAARNPNPAGRYPQAGIVSRGLCTDSGYPALFDGLYQCGVVKNWYAFRYVYDPRGLLHRPEYGLAHHGAGLGRRRHRDHDEIELLQELVHLFNGVRALNTVHGFARRTSRGQDSHSESRCSEREGLSHMAHAKDTYGLARKIFWK